MEETWLVSECYLHTVGFGSGVHPASLIFLNYGNKKEHFNVPSPVLNWKPVNLEELKSSFPSKLDEASMTPPALR